MGAESFLAIQKTPFLWTMATSVTKWLIPLLLLLLTGTSMWAGLLQEAPEAPPYTISLNVDLVLLDVSVVDHDGKFVSDLEAENFKIYEDGRPEVVAYFLKKDVPVTVGLAIDNSG